MDKRSQIEAFQCSLELLIERFQDEFDLSYASMIGVIEFVKFQLMNEAAEIVDDDEAEGPTDDCGLYPSLN